ncbi:hypothetical protein LIA77_00932 [Sarocladium implicatum]|nr:hypothetical protein LIA77_00932 [Sarocladium implicatum]
MAENKIKTKEVEDGSSKDAIIGTPSSIAATITAPSRPPPLEMLVQDSSHPLRPFLLDAMGLAKNPHGLNEFRWNSEADVLAQRHKVAVAAYLQGICALVDPSKLCAILSVFVDHLLAGPSPNCEYDEEEAARLLVDQLEDFVTRCASPLRPGAGPLFSCAPTFCTEPPNEASLGGLPDSSPLSVDKTCKSCEKLSQKMDVTVRQIATILASLDVPKSSKDALQELLDFGR